MKNCSLSKIKYWISVSLFLVILSSSENVYSQKAAAYYIEAKKQMALEDYGKAYHLLYDSIKDEEQFYVRNYRLDIAYCAYKSGEITSSCALELCKSYLKAKIERTVRNV